MRPIDTCCLCQVAPLASRTRRIFRSIDRMESAWTGRASASALPIGTRCKCQLVEARKPGSRRGVSEREAPGLRGGLDAELLLRLLAVCQLEAGSGVDAAGRCELALRPEGQLAVAEGAGEADALVDELLADLAASGGGIDDQEAELGDAFAS